MIYISTDHAGFDLIPKIVDFLKNLGEKVNNLAPQKFDPLDDYPDFAFKLARETVKNSTFGILLCRSGAGMSIAANKIKGARAVVCQSSLQARKAREHNNSNILVLAADFTSFEEMKKIIKTFLETDFSREERHCKRLEKIKKFEEGGQND